MRKDAKGGEDDDDEGSLKDFICDEDEESDMKDTDDEDSDIQEVDEVWFWCKVYINMSNFYT